MVLSPPKVKGPVSTCNKSVRIKGYIAGAKVSVLVDGSITSTKVSKWPDDVFDINFALQGGEAITAIQEFGNEKSKESPLKIKVQSPPTTLSNPSILTHPYEYGRGIWVQGAVSGSDLIVTIDNNEVGKKTSVDGTAQVTYIPGLQSGHSLNLEEKTCNNLSNNTVSEIALKLPRPRIPVPVIEKGTLVECQRAIKFSNILGGAFVLLDRGAKSSKVICTTSSGYIRTSPLVKGEEVLLRQGFAPKAQQTTPTIVSDPLSAKVQGIEQARPPTILGQLCENSTSLKITDLLPTATVVITQNKVEIGRGDAMDTTETFYVEPLSSNAPVTAHMELCNKRGKESADKTVKSHSIVDDIRVQSLYECASYIVIPNFNYELNGATIYVLNGHGDMISDYEYIASTPEKMPYYASYSQMLVLIPVSPSLLAGDKLTIKVLGCGGQVEKSFGEYIVNPAKIEIPQIAVPIEGNKFAEIKSGIAGALISVYVDDVFSGQAISLGAAPNGNSNPTRVYLQNPLKLNQHVKANQSLCGQVSKDSDPATVVIPWPVPPKLIEPADNADGVSTSHIFFKWNDPRANTHAKATSFRVYISKNDVTVYKSDDLSSTPPLTYNPIVNLDYETSYVWQMFAYNSSGSGFSSKREFTTMSDQPGGGGGGGGGNVASLRVSTSATYVDRLNSVKFEIVGSNGFSDSVTELGTGPNPKSISASVDVGSFTASTTWDVTCMVDFHINHPSCTYDTNNQHKVHLSGPQINLVTFYITETTTGSCPSYSLES